MNVSSVAGHLVFQTAAVYCATKFAVRALSEGIRMESDGSIRVTNIGAGGAGGELAFAQARKGYACIHMFDADIVEPSNLNRQYFDRSNLGQNKAHALVKRLRGEGFRGSRLVGHPYYYDQLLDSYLASLGPDVITVCIDQLLPGARADASRLARLINVPAVFVAISDDADWGYVFVQESDPDQACWGCVIHGAEVSDRKRCPGTVGATIDPLKMLTGMASYAIDTLVMNRPRDWNYRAISLSRSGMFFSTKAPRRPDCALCGKASAWARRRTRTSRIEAGPSRTSRGTKPITPANSA